MRATIRRCWECGRVHDGTECPDCGCEASEVLYPGELPVPRVDPDLPGDENEVEDEDNE